MSSKLTFRRGVQFLALALLVLLVAIALGTINTTLLRPQPVHAAEPAAPVNMFACITSSVAVFNNRVDVQCTTAPGDAPSVYYFAVPTSDASNASRYLSIFTSARLTGKAIYLWYTPGDTSGAAWGCQASDCRAISGVRVW